MIFRNKVIFLMAFFSLCCFIVSGCGNIASNAPTGGKLKIITSVYPVYDFTRRIGGDKVDVTILVPPGVEPHDWEPTAKEILQIKSAKLFLYHGAGLENLGKLINQETLGSTKAVAVSANIPELTLGHDQEADDHHHDSHMWLDPVTAQAEADNIANALAAVDPQNSTYYLGNAEKFKGELALLDAEYQKELANVARREIVTSHAAFSYLAKRYNLTQTAIMGLSPDSEPTPEKMAKVVAFCRENKVKYIFFETIVSPKLAETIARETGAGLLTLNPVENLTAEEINQGKNYLSIMRENLANLKKALSE